MLKLLRRQKFGFEVWDISQTYILDFGFSFKENLSIHRVTRHLCLLLNLGPSGVRALPLAAGINVGGHYKWHFFLSLSPLSLSPAHC